MRRAALLLAVFLVACQTTAPAPEAPAAGVTHDLAADYAPLAGQGSVYTVDPARSTVRLYVFRAGAMGKKVGHNHVFAAPQFEGRVFVPASDEVTGAKFDLHVRLDALAVDDPKWRADTGGSFAGERSASDIEGTKKNMLKGLEAADHPDVWLSAQSLAGDWPILVADVAVRLHDVTKVQPVMLTIQRSEPGRIQASGQMVLKQSDFGVTPFSVMGGLLAVEDVVAIRFDVVGAIQQ